MGCPFSREQLLSRTNLLLGSRVGASRSPCRDAPTFLQKPGFLQNESSQRAHFCSRRRAGLAPAVMVLVGLDRCRRSVLLEVLRAAAGRRMRARRLHLRSFLSAAGLGGRALLRSQRGGDRGLPGSFLVLGFAPRLGEKQHEDLSVQQVPSGADFSPSQNPVPWLCAGLAVPCCPLALQTAPGQPRAVSVSSRNVPRVPQPGTEGW